MKPFPDRWQSLTQAARNAHDDRFEMPPGFATRVLARWKEAPEESLLEVMTLLSKRFLMASALLFLLSTVLAASLVDVTELTPNWIEPPITARLLLP
jgi:hypothetical protein